MMKCINQNIRIDIIIFHYQIGSIRNKLENLGITGNTVIISSTDHRLHFGEFGLGYKKLLCVPDVHISLIRSILKK